MKVLVATILILILFFSLSLYINHYITQASDQLSEMIKELDEAIQEENWEEAQVQIEKIGERWDETKKVWVTFLEHYEIDAIDIVLARVKKYVSIQENTQALGDLAELRLLIQHIVEREAFKLGNIL